jgi:hypothetical protein
MKTQLVKKTASALLVLFCLFCFSSKAFVFSSRSMTKSKFTIDKQLIIANPYKIKNGLACTITVTYRLYNLSGSSCLLCTSPVFNVQIAPGATLNIVLPAGCVPGCDVVVTLTDIGGFAPVGPIDVSSGHPNSSGTSGNTTCPNYNMQWTGGMTTIN